MNRKTNIFYNDNTEDTRFITFNNYSEALTGDILATDYKLWPSRFICLYIDELDIKNLTLSVVTEDNLSNRQAKYNENKKKLIEVLEQYYENKLAVLRDNLETHDDLKPLNYLISALYYFIYNLKQTNAENNIDAVSNIEEKLFSNENNIQDLIDFNYISDIVEQQYNGTYSDIICTINPHKWEKPIINFVNLDTSINSYLNEDNKVITITNESFLYGWNNISDDVDTESNQHKMYEKVHNNQIKDDLVLIENDTPVYYVNSLIKNIEIMPNTSSSNKLRFNLLIPLFNSINIKNANDISNTEEDLTSIELNNKVNIPLGIYFTGDTIELSIDNKYATNWSVLISTQFSAFPFSFDIHQNFDDSQTTKQAFITYAEILANQLNAYSSLDKYDSIIKTLQSRIIMLESKINNISTIQNIDDLAKSISDLRIRQENLINDFNNQINNLRKSIEEAKLKWHITTRS